MKTDDLIAALSQDATPVKAGAALRRLGGALALGFALSAVVVLGLLGPRPDFVAAIDHAALKALFAAALLAAGVVLLVRAARPALDLRAALAPAVVLIGASVLAALALTSLAPAGAKLATLFPVGFPPCLRDIPLVAIPAAAVIGLAVRRLGPTRLVHAGAAVGAAAGGIGAIAHTLHCPFDNPAYVLAWSSLAVALCAGVGALLGPRLLRW